jgi:hypothetical protein
MSRMSCRSLGISLAVSLCIVGLLLLQRANIMEGYDLARMHQFYKSDLRAMVLAGEMPWWNPYTAFGRPFLADIETATLYPPTWLIIPFGVTLGIFLMIWLHLALAIEGARLLGESLGISRVFAWAAGISFALSGALLGRLQSGQLQVFCVICLWPWIWRAAIKLQDQPGRKAVVRLAGWLALGFLAGSPQLLWCGLVIATILLATRFASFREMPLLFLGAAAAGLLAAGIAAVQLLPFVELLQQGNRPLHDTIFATQGGETGSDWLTLLVPPGSWLRSDGEFNLHSGGLFSILACAAVAAGSKNRNMRALAIAGLFGFILALGDHTPLLPALADWIPGFAGVRYPSRYALASVLTISLLAVWWLDSIYREKQVGLATLILCLSVQGATLIGGLFVQASIYRVPSIPENQAVLKRDLLAEGLPGDGAPPRVALPASILTANAGAQSGVTTISGFNNPALTRTWNALYTIAGEPVPDFHRAEVKDRVILKLNERPDYFGLSAVFKMPGNRITFMPPLIPRAFVSFNATRVTNAAQAVLRIREGHDFVREALVEDASLVMNSSSGRKGDATIVGFSRNRIVTECRATAPGLLVLAESWYPGWTVTINGIAKGPTVPVNGWMRGVQIPEGTNRVVFSYTPTYWWWGVLTSASSLLLVLVLWVPLRFTHVQRPLAE